MSTNLADVIVHIDGTVMKITAAAIRHASVLGVLLLTVAISVSGCASYSHSNVAPSDAATALSIGDEVEVTRKDGTTAYFKVEEISNTEISGSLLTNMLGRNVSIAFADIASITRYIKDGHDSQQTAEVVGGILGLALFVSIL